MNPGTSGTPAKTKPASARTASPFDRFRRPDLAPSLAQGGVLAKDFAKQTPTAAGMFAAALGLAFFPVTMLWLNDGIWRSKDLVDSCLQVYPAMLMISAFVLALSAGAEEEEAGTRALLDLLPARPIAHFAAKLGAVLALTALLGLVGGVVFGLLAGDVPAMLARGLANPPEVFRNTSSDGTVPVVPALAAAVASFGLLAALAFPNILIAGVTGGLGAAFWIYQGAALVTGQSGARTMHDSFALIAASLALVVICGTVYSVAWPWARERDSRRGLSQWADGQSRACALPGAWLRRLAAGRVRFGALSSDGQRAASEVGDHGMAGIDPMQLPLAISCVVIALGQPLLAWLVNGEGASTQPSLHNYLAAAVFTFIPAAALGSYAFSAGERDSIRYFLHALPIRREVFFRARMLWLARASACIVGSMIAGMGISIGILMVVAGGTISAANFTFGNTWTAFGFSTIPAIAAVSALLNAALARLFQTRRLVAFAAGFACGVANLFSAGLGILGLANRIGAPETVEAALWAIVPVVVQTIWCTAIAVALPVGAMAVALCRSRLLEQPERRRGTLGLLLAIAIAGWTVLLGFSPTQLWNILMP